MKNRDSRDKMEKLIKFDMHVQYHQKHHFEKNFLK